VALVGCVAITCAKGAGDDEGGPDTTSAQTTAAGGAGGQGGTGGTGGLGGFGGMGGFGGTCSEMPCKLVEPQCGCADGEQCTLVQSMRSCEPDGTVEEGMNCSGLNCMAGNLCLNYAGLSTCRHYCNDDLDCNQPGGQCVLTLQNGTETFCSDNCDPPSNTGCIANGAKCDLFLAMDMQWFTLCAPDGNGTQDTPCDGPEDCALGYGCVTDGMMVTACRHYCDTMAPACPGITQCAGFTTPATVGVKTYGACL
jgi:hypothetical protein